MGISTKLIVACLDGELSEEQERNLRHKLETDAECREMLAEGCRQRLMLAQILKEHGSVPSAEMQAPFLSEKASSGLGKTRPAWRKVSRWVKAAPALVASLAILAGAWFLSREPARIATLIVARPGMTVERSQGLLNPLGSFALYSDDLVRIEKRGMAVIRYDDATEMEIGENSMVILEPMDRESAGGKFIRLECGTLSANVAKQPADRPLVVQTPTASVQVVGTEFKLQVEEDSTRLNVREGAVRFRRRADQMEIVVSSGQQAVAFSKAGVPLVASATDEVPSTSAFGGKLLFRENFETNDLASRGWYDLETPVFSSEEHIPGSRRSVEFRFLEERTASEVGNAIRRKFPGTDAVEVNYWIKHGADWTHPAMAAHVMLMTNKDGDWEGAGHTHLTVTLGEVEGRPAILIQDGKNLDESRLGEDLAPITESRAVAGGNGDSDGHGEGVFYLAGDPPRHYTNRKAWVALGTSFRKRPGLFHAEGWHHVKASLKLNTLSDGRANPDGCLQYWLDGALVMEHDNLVFRTGWNEDMQFSQFLVAPHIFGGSLAEQVFWIDDLALRSIQDPGDSDF